MPHLETENWIMIVSCPHPGSYAWYEVPVVMNTPPMATK